MTTKELAFAGCRKDVSLPARGLILVLFSFINKKRECRPTRAQLLERSGLTANTLYLRIEELRTAGLLATHQTRDEKGHIRTMFVLAPIEPQATKPLSQFLGQGPCLKVCDKETPIYSRVRA